jgi:hypothetical protein
MLMRSSWYASTSFRKGYMSDGEKDAIYGRLAREIKTLESDLAYLSTQIHTLGAALKVTGESLQNLDFNIDRETATLELSKVWSLIERYKQADVDLSTKRTQMEKIDSAA